LQNRGKSLVFLLIFQAWAPWIIGCSPLPPSNFTPLPCHKIELTHIYGGPHMHIRSQISEPQSPALSQLPDFWMSRTEIQVQTFAQFLQAQPDKQATYIDQTVRCAGRIRPRPGFSKRPVTGISIKDAQAFCIWLTAISGRTCRLPTPSEWVHMANGGRSGMPYPWGWESPATRAVFNAAGPRESGFYGPYGRGLVDVAGNVYEWSLDATTRRAYIHGGAWSDQDPAHLSILSPFEQPPEHRSPDIGFRILVEQ